MAVDLQDLSRRLFQTANQLWTNTALRPDQYGRYSSRRTRIAGFGRTYGGNSYRWTWSSRF